MMLKSRLIATLLSLALLGNAAAQEGARTVYFVFSLATALPLTLQATPECVAARETWNNVQAAPDAVPGGTLLETYSFVSDQGLEKLRQDFQDWLGEHGFTEAPPAAGEGAGPNGMARETARRHFHDPALPGYTYTVQLYERSGEPGTPSALCVTVSGPSPQDGPAPLESDD